MLRPAVSFCLFVSFAEGGAAVALNALRALRAGEKARVHTPAKAHDPYLDDGAPPALVVQLYFAGLPELEAALPRLEKALGAGGSCEAMLVRRFTVPSPAVGRCTYLVAYAGPAEDPDAWHAHYLAHHPPIMAELPGIRELEIYTPVQWVSGATGWRRVRSLQRNKVAFDSPQALEAALNSPVRAKMRADFATFPPHTGTVSHYPMLTIDPWEETRARK
jgi:uncharacterized protein (TIGR02118 family)